MNNFIKQNWIMIVLIISVILMGVLFVLKSKFKPVMEIDKKTPVDIPEEIGLAMKYPQGSGVAMDKEDSNSFTPTKPGPLLSDHMIPEAYGDSSYAGHLENSRIIKLKDTGNQDNFKPYDSSEESVFAEAYNNNTKPVHIGNAFVNGASPIDYSSHFSPEKSMVLESAAGTMSTTGNCEKRYPAVEHYAGHCITEGDIPYGKVVNGKVNPRLVSRWESYTGNYSTAEALEPYDGSLYPKLE